MISVIRLTVLTLCFISVLSFFSKPKPEEHLKNLGHSWEKYDPSYFNRFQTIQSIIHYSDSISGAQEKNTLKYYNFIAEVIRRRFYHGYSYYYFSDNPLAYTAGCIWSNLSAIVIPDDIMKHPMAACSQQSIVLTEIFKRNKINYRKVGFDGHYAIEGFIEGQWRYFDTDMEPNLLPTRESVNKLQMENKLELAYSNTGINANYLHTILKQPKLGKLNEIPGSKATLFHKICLLLVSKWFLLAVFILSFWSTIQLRVLKKMFGGINSKRQEFDKVNNLWDSDNKYKEAV